MNSIGIDVHKRDSQVAVLNEDGELVDEVRVTNANHEEYLDVVVAHPAKTKAIGAAKVKNDRLDAKLFAQLRHVEMIAESYVLPAEIRERCE